MSRKRWAPIAHGFNRDIEVQELRKRYADWMGYVWIEMFSIADLNDGVVKGTPKQIADSLAYISLRKRPSFASKVIQNSFTFMEVSGWIRVESDRVLILKSAEYRPSGVTINVPTNQPTNPSDLTNLKKTQEGAVDKSVDNSEEPGEIASRIYHLDTERFARVGGFVSWARSERYTDPVISRALKWLLEVLQKGLVINDWWAYAATLLKKAYAEFQQRRSAIEKEEEARFVSALVNRVATARAV